MPRTIALAACTLIALTGAHAADVKRQQDAGLRYAVPMTWNRVPAPSDMRAAQFQIPAPEGAAGGEGGELVLLFFGKGQGGSAEQNLQRWYGQFQQPDGKPSSEAAVVTIRTINGLKVTAVDVSGTYTAMPVRGAAPGAGKANYRMLAAVVEGEGGPWFFRATGPAATIGAAKPQFDAMLESLEAHN